jgi:hypothetical protein
MGATSPERLSNLLQNAFFCFIDHVLRTCHYVTMEKHPSRGFNKRALWPARPGFPALPANQLGRFRGRAELLPGHAVPIRSLALLTTQPHYYRFSDGNILNLNLFCWCHPGEGGVDSRQR